MIEKIDALRKKIGLGLGFGEVRIVKDNKSKYIVFAKEKASGVINEDVFLYQIVSNKLVPIAEFYNLKKMCVFLEKRDKNLVLLDGEKKVLVLISKD